MTFELRRRALTKVGEPVQRATANTGLLLRRGLSEWPGAGNTGDVDDSGGAGIAKAALISHIAGILPDSGYCWAYRRWCQATTDDTRFVSLELRLLSRLYIGVVRDNPVETGVTVGHAWGMPLIPGSAIKGVARQAARQVGWPPEAIVLLFGSEPPAPKPTVDGARNAGAESSAGAEATDSPESSAALNSESGLIVFHDAWWIPCPDTDKNNTDKSRPFVEEVVTPHHRAYYGMGGAHASDFDSPIPAPQIAVQGRFRFVLEGPSVWREHARILVCRALTEAGVGSKTTSGYGLFERS